MFAFLLRSPIYVYFSVSARLLFVQNLNAKPLPGPFLENFLGGVLFLRVPTKMGVADDR